MFRLIAAASILALASMSGYARSADGIPLPAQSLACLVEHQEAYLNLPRALIIFFPAFCPSVEREEVAKLVENNSDVGGQPAQRLIITKADFACLIGKIETHLALDLELSEDDAKMFYFALDCE